MCAVQALEETGQLDNTYIFYTADNGFKLGHHRLVSSTLPPRAPRLRNASCRKRSKLFMDSSWQQLNRVQWLGRKGVGGGGVAVGSGLACLPPAAPLWSASKCSCLLMNLFVWPMPCAQPGKMSP